MKTKGMQGIPKPMMIRTTPTANIGVFVSSVSASLVLPTPASNIPVKTKTAETTMPLVAKSRGFLGGGSKKIKLFPKMPKK